MSLFAFPWRCCSASSILAAPCLDRVGLPSVEQRPEQLAHRPEGFVNARATDILDFSLINLRCPFFLVLVILGYAVPLSDVSIKGGLRHYDRTRLGIIW